MNNENEIITLLDTTHINIEGLEDLDELNVENSNIKQKHKMVLSRNQCYRPLSKSDIDLYFSMLDWESGYKIDIKHLPTIKKSKVKSKKTKINSKGDDDDIDNDVIPLFKDYKLLTQDIYNTNQLKSFVKHYKLKISGNKDELITRLYNFLKWSYKIVQIQKIYRGFLQRTYNTYHGPAYLNRSLCTNTTDFMTMDNIKEIPFSQFFSYEDIDKFIYGFDIISLYNLTLKSVNGNYSGGIFIKKIKNPYNRNDIPENVIKNIKKFVNISKILKIQLDIDIKDVAVDVSPQKLIELKTLELFQHINSLGNYSNATWFSSLDKPQLLRYLKHLYDIWNYRAQMSFEVRRSISPPYGEPFRHVNIPYLMNNEPNIDTIKKQILSVMEKMVKYGTNIEYQTIGAMHVLGGLTLVNEVAATAIPWLHNAYINVN